MSSERLAVDVADPSVAAPEEGALSIVIPEPPITVRLGWFDQLKEHRKTWMAIRGFREALIVGVVYSLYDLTRYLVAGESSVAHAHGRSLLHLEKVIGFAPEHALNKVSSAHLALSLPLDYAYATLHYLLTPLVLIWMWRRHGPASSSARSVLMLAAILGLV